MPFRPTSLTALLLLAGAIWLNSGSAAAANLTLLHEGVRQSFQNLSDSLDEFQSLPCLTKKASEHLAGYQANAGTVFQTFHKHYGTYIVNVTKPMQGDGKCDGGFSSVAKESDVRQKASVDYSTKITAMQAQFNLAMAGDFDDADIDMPDESESGDCEKTGAKMYDIVQLNGALVNTSVTAFRSGVDETARNFQAYTQVNKGLQGNCGSQMSSLANVATTATGNAAPVAPVPGGKSESTASTITGKIDDPSLPDPQATSKLAPGGMKKAFAGSAASLAVETQAASVHADIDTSLTPFSDKMRVANADMDHSAEKELSAFIAPQIAPPGSTATPATATTAGSVTTDTTWNAGIPGTCYELEKCTGQYVSVKNAGECPASERYFRQDAPGGLCQHLPPK